MKIKKGFVSRMVLGQPTIIGEGIGLVNFNKLITLNASAAYLWQCVEGKTFSTEDLAALLVEKYEINHAIALADATDILKQWSDNGLIEK